MSVTRPCMLISGKPMREIGMNVAYDLPLPTIDLYRIEFQSSRLLLELECSLGPSIDCSWFSPNVTFQGSRRRFVMDHHPPLRERGYSDGRYGPPSRRDDDGTLIWTDATIHVILEKVIREM